MIVRYCNHEQKGPGYGYFLCSGEQFTATDYCVQVQRSVDRSFLGQDGAWDAPKVQLLLPGTLLQGALVLPLGPTLVNALSTRDTYRLTLVPKEGGSSYTSQLKIASIRYSTEDALNNAMIVGTPEAPRPEPEPEPEPQQKTDVPHTEKPRSRGGLFLLWLALAALLCALALWYVFVFKAGDPGTTVPKAAEVAEKNGTKTQPEKDENVLKEENPSSLKESSSPSVPAEPAVPSAGSVPAESVPEILSVEQRVQQFFAAKERDTSRAVALAKELAHERPEEQDAIFRLYYFVSEKGETSLLMEYAACLDPSTPAWGSIHKDALAAWRIYEQAKVSRPEAQAAQAHLRAWLEEHVQSDPQAAEWLARLPK